jgi:DNA-binding GntR family transcriptional regulator
VRSTRREIAEDVGTSEDRVTKALLQLRAEALVDFHDHEPRRIILMNREKLERYARL